jgi:ATP-dependent helicase/nuclease subunit B
MTPAVDDLLAAAADGALVLTATRRLARRLRRLYDRGQAAAGRRAWPTPAIYSGDAWLQLTADRLGDGWRLLTSAASRRLWETIVAADGAGSAQELLQGSATARAAEEAHALLVEFGGDPHAFPLTGEHAALLRWRRLYVERLRQEGWLDRSSLPQTIVAAVAAGRLPLPSAVFFAGFDDLPPRFRRLARAFSERGAVCREIACAGRTSTQPLRLTCADSRDEVRRAAVWARGLLEGGETEIGIVVPDLPKYRSLIERIFREEIDPAAQVRPAAEEIRFNLSLGEPLAHKGAVVAAFEILTAGHSLPLAQAGFLLRTPYLGGALGEEEGRARLDARLRKEGSPQISLSRIMALAGDRRNPTGDPRRAPFAQVCERLLAARSDRRERLPGAWASHFAELLQTVGWPGERPLDSLDFQVVKAFREKLLPQLAAFDLISGAVSRGEALLLLRRLAMETEFQPEGAESPVQVVGLLEAAGLHFRHLWVMGMHDGALPAPCRPNPFLPVALQIAAGMPHADADRELAFARRVFARLSAAGERIVFSHPRREGDAERLPSPFIRELPAADLPAPPSRSPALLFQQKAPPAETLVDAAGPPLAAGEEARGGTAIFKDQALCPFRAFVRHRLAATALETPDIGLDPRERGNLLHKAMQVFWTHTGGHRQLLALSEEERRRRIAASIEAALQSVSPAGEGLLPLLLALEKGRLARLLEQWLLQAEIPRAPFTVLDAEKEGSGQFGGVPFTTRIDRIDRLDDGRLVVIDYKTGRISVADLLGECLLEPQLPMYCLGREGEVAAVAFAGLRPEKCAFQGAAAAGDILPGVKAAAADAAGSENGWRELLAHWRRQLETLGCAFAAGAATIAPVDVQKACRYCEFTPLCRQGDAEEGGDA